MGYQLKIIVVLSAAYFASYFILAQVTKFKDELKQYLTFTVSIISITVLTKSVFLGFLFAAIACAYFTKKSDTDKKIAFYLGVMFSFPNEAALSLNIGLDLGFFNYQKLIIFCLLVPIFFKEKKDKRFSKANIIDVFVLLFFTWQMLVNFREGITSVIRMDFWTYIDFVLPYIVVRRYASNYPLILGAICFGLLSQMFVSCFEAFTTWKIFDSLRQVSGFVNPTSGMYKFRHGLLRTEAVFGNPLVLSLFSNLAFLAIYTLIKSRNQSSEGKKPKIFLIGALLTSIAGCICTGSRAGMAGLVLSFFLYQIIAWATSKKRDPKPVVVWGGVITTVLILTFAQGFLQETFGYRYRLFVVASDVILDNFLFGSSTPTEDPRMDVLKTGEGIVDLVNSYIFFALYYGLPGIYLFLCVIGFTFFRIYEVLRMSTTNDEKTIAIFILCSLLIIIFNLSTTSPIGWTYGYLWVLIPIASNLFTFTHRKRR